MEYLIDYKTGAGNETVNGTLEEAKKIAEKGMCYTQQNVDIYEVYSDEKKIVATSTWWGVPVKNDDECADVLISFENLGFYEKWSDKNND